ncbi:MAG: hypothetical protein SOW13_05410, partial [Sodaliphilus sp.]|nr:hypothetical protein [Sodaliphilus sp.]
AKATYSFASTPKIKPKPPIRKGELQETYSSPFIVKKSPILCILFTVLHKKADFCALQHIYCTKKSHF